MTLKDFLHKFKGLYQLELHFYEQNHRNALLRNYHLNCHSERFPSHTEKLEPFSATQLKSYIYFYRSGAPVTPQPNTISLNHLKHHDKQRYRTALLNNFLESMVIFKDFPDAQCTCT